MASRPPRPWTTADTRELCGLAAAGFSAREIATRMDRDRSLVETRAKRVGIKIRKVQIKTPWTPQDDATLRALYPTQTAVAIGRRMGRKAASINYRAAKLGLKKPEGYVSQLTRWRWKDGQNENSRRAHFPKGNVPHNKGAPMAEWMPNPGRSVETRFRKGNLTGQAARNYVPIGSLRINKQGLLERKVTDDPSIYPARRWTSVARLVWEAAHGPIPRRHVVRFKPGTATTVEAEITLDKLECISMRENMRRNSYHTNFPPELRRLTQLRGALTHKIKNRSKKG